MYKRTLSLFFYEKIFNKRKKEKRALVNLKIVTTNLLTIVILLHFRKI